MARARPPRGEIGRGALRIVKAAVFLTLSGCVSYSYVDDHDVQHVIGFVDVAIPGADGHAPKSVSVTGFGLFAFSHPDRGSGVVLGYSRETSLELPNGSCLDLNSVGTCSAKRDPIFDNPHPKEITP